jgi:hypothetical protein
LFLRLAQLYAGFPKYWYADSFRVFQALGAVMLAALGTAIITEAFRRRNEVWRWVLEG